MKDKPPLIAHVIFRLGIGGLENGLVNLINNMPESKYRHVIICASDYTDFKNRIKRSDVEVYALHKKEGNDISSHLRMWKLLRKLKPDIVHTRNLGTLEYVVSAYLAGVRRRLHGEHGRDMSDIDGSNKKYVMLRRLHQPLVNKFVALSKDLENWLLENVAVPRKKVAQIYNGVDLSRFKVGSDKLPFDEFSVDDGDLLIGTVGRLQGEKDQATLIKAFDLLLSRLDKEKSEKLKLALIGDGPDREKLQSLVEALGISNNVIFLGARNDIPSLLNGLDLFVLPSLGEGISNTILEAMASGLPVVATAVGGNPELVVDNQTGLLVPSGNPEAMAAAMYQYVVDDEKRRGAGDAGRKRAEEVFSIESMVNAYVDLYDQALNA